MLSNTDCTQFEHKTVAFPTNPLGSLRLVETSHPVSKTSFRLLVSKLGPIPKASLKSDRERRLLLLGVPCVLVLWAFL